MQDLTERQVWEAYKPLLDLLGITPHDVFNEPPLAVFRDDDGVLTIRYHKVVDPDAPREDWPTVEVGESPFRELAYEVTIKAGRPGEVEDVWPDAEYPPGTRVGGDDD